MCFEVTIEEWEELAYLPLFSLLWVLFFFLLNCHCILWCKCIMTHIGSHSVAHQAWAHIWRCTHVHRGAHREVCWISKWKWKFEPQVWHSVTCNQHRWQTFLRGCMLAPIGGCWVILAVHVSPRHALLCLIIILHYLWVPLPLNSWHTADTPPCSMHLTPGHVPPECKEAASWTSMSLQLSSFVSRLSATPTPCWYLKQFST